MSDLLTIIFICILVVFFFFLAMLFLHRPILAIIIFAFTAFAVYIRMVKNRIVKQGNTALHKNYNLLDIDYMDGHDFEYFCAGLLRSNGFSNVRVTKASGDQGVDIIATKNGAKYAIQCKRSSNLLGNRPIQEVVSGRAIYHCDKAAVLTNTYFNSSAQQAAQANGVDLWDRDTLLIMMKFS